MSTGDRPGEEHGSAPLVFGEVLFDRFPDGSRVPGGAPFNVAWHLQALGARPVLISAVGDDDMGREIRGIMERWGMSTLGLQIDPGHATGEVRVSLHDGQPEFDIVNGRAYDHIRAPSLPSTEAALVYHGSLALRGQRSAAALDALLESTGAPVFVDVNLREPWWRAEDLERRLHRARWVKLNRHELRVLHGDHGDTADAAMHLVERYRLDLVIVTLGEEGALLLDAAGVRVCTPAVHGVQVVDTVGAGDAFAAVCVLGLLRGWSLGAIAERAQRLASLMVTRRGATSEDRAPYLELMRTWHDGAHPTSLTGSGR